MSSSSVPGVPLKMQASATRDVPAAPAQSLWRRAWEGWKRIAHVIGVFQTRLIMTILFFIIVLPIGLIARAASDPLHLRPRKDGNWVPLQPHPHSIESAHQQF